MTTVACPTCGEAAVFAANDAMAIGNHEFDFGVTRLQAQQARAHFPFLATNIVDAAMMRLMVACQRLPPRR